MPNSPPALSIPPTRQPWVSETGHATPTTAQWLELLHKRVGGAQGLPIIGDVAVYQTTVTSSNLASAALFPLLTALSGEQWKIREMFLSGDGTNFSGGDRLISVTDGTSIWSVIPAATAQSLAVARWGDSGLPFPATASHMTTASAAGTSISAQYSGGASDYSAGNLTLIITAERMA